MGISILGGSSNSPVVETHERYSDIAELVGVTTLNQTYVPTYSGLYIFSYDLIDTDNQVTANLGTAPGTSDVFNGGALRLGNLDNERKSYQAEVMLTAGTTYYIFSFVGGGTTFGRIRVNIFPRTFTSLKS